MKMFNFLLESSGGSMLIMIAISLDASANEDKI